MIPSLAAVISADGSLVSFLAVGLLAAILSLDDVALGQTWFGQPLPAAVITGWLCGDPLTGLAIGLPFQIILIGNLPVGQSFTGEPTAATIGVTGGVILGGSSMATHGLNPSLENLGLLGWVLLAAGLCSIFGNFVVALERRGHVFWMMEGHRTLRDGVHTRMDRIHVRCLVTTFIRGLILGLLYLMIVLRLWIPLFGLLPEYIVKAMRILPLLATGVGIGSLIDRYGLRICWPWLAGATGITILFMRFVV